MPDSATPILRALQPRDIPALLRLSMEANWNQTADDWATLIELSPQGCMGIEIDGELMATATLFCYQRRLAWIGMVLTKVSHRGLGFARRLLAHALTRADELGIETVKLDATDQGQPLYEKLGFRCEQPVERWGRTAKADAPLSPSPREQARAENWFASDVEAFGVDRSRLLIALARRHPPICGDRSYLLMRTGRMNKFMGPCVADGATSAQSLIGRALKDESIGWSWDLFPKNISAVAMARDLGFTPQRHLMRMVRGKELRAHEELIFALAGFELG